MNLGDGCLVPEVDELRRALESRDREIAISHRELQLLRKLAGAARSVVSGGRSYEEETFDLLALKHAIKTYEDWLALR